MALSNTTVKASYVGNGSNTNFAIPFDPIVDDSAETVVYVRDTTQDPVTETLQTEGALNDYTLTGAPDVSSFHTTVTFNTAPVSTDVVVVVRVLPKTQTLDLNPNGGQVPESLEQALDRLSAQIQELNEEVGRSPRLPASGQISDANMIIPEPSANEVIGWNAAATALRSFTAGELSILAAALTSSDDLPEGATNLYYTNARVTTLLGTTSINALSDVTITTPSNGEVLKYNGSIWVNDTDAGSSPLTTKGDLFTYSTADARLGVGSLNSVLSPNGAETTGLEWKSPSELYIPGVEYDNTDDGSSLVKGEHAIMTGSAFELLTPSSADIGQEFSVTHNGNNLVVYTISADFGEDFVIGGQVVSTAVKLHTRGESMTFRKVEAGTSGDWAIVSHTCNTGLSSSSTITIEGVSSNPSKGTTTTDTVRWRREGQYLWGYYEYVQTGAGTAGTGDYLFGVPAGLTIDTSLVSVNTVNNTITSNTTVMGQFVGFAGGGNQLTPGQVVPYSSTRFRLTGFVGGAANVVKGGSTLSLNNTTVSFGGWIKVPITDWLP